MDSILVCAFIAEVDFLNIWLDRSDLNPIGQFALPWDKRQMYEFDIRIPLMVFGPDVVPGTMRMVLVVIFFLLFLFKTPVKESMVSPCL